MNRPGDRQPVAGRASNERPAGAGAVSAASASGWVVVPTSIGGCVLAWAGEHIVGCQLPEADTATAVRRVRARLASQGLPPVAAAAEPPAFVAAVAARLQAVLAGAADDLADVPLAFDGIPAFDRRVYALARAIPVGCTLTYGEVARRLGAEGAARAVGGALGRNPFAPIVPCHRVLAAGARPGGFSAHGGVDTKLRLLALERARVGDAPDLFD